MFFAQSARCCPKRWLQSRFHSTPLTYWKYTTSKLLQAGEPALYLSVGSLSVAFPIQSIVQGNSEISVRYIKSQIISFVLFTFKMRWWFPQHATTWYLASCLSLIHPEYFRIKQDSELYWKSEVYRVQSPVVLLWCWPHSQTHQLLIFINCAPFVRCSIIQATVKASTSIFLSFSHYRAGWTEWKALEKSKNVILAVSRWKWVYWSR